MVRNTFSTFSEFLALVSRKEISRDEAKSLEGSSGLREDGFNSLEDHYVLFYCENISVWTLFLLVYLSGGGVDHLPTDQVRLVSHQQPGDTFTGVTIDLIQPQFHVVERLLRKKERK